MSADCFVPGAVPPIFHIDLSACRFCLQDIDTFDKMKIDDSLRDSFQELMNFELIRNEKLPSFCCRQCCQEISNSARIKRKVSETQSNLMRILDLKFPSDSLESQHHSVKVEITTPDFDYDGLSFNQNQKFQEIDVKSEVEDDFDSFVDPDYFEEPIKTRKVKKGPKNEAEKKVVKRKKPRETKSSAERVKCEICNTKVSKFTYTIHLSKKHLGVEHFQCDQCSSSYVQKSALVDHMQTRHMLVESRTRYNCSDCDKSYLNQYTLDQHYRHKHLHHVDRICEICGISITSRFRYNDHMRSKHTLETPYKCDTEGCEYQCSTSAMLREHKIRFHPKGTSVCNICFKTFSTVKKLHNHKRLHKEKNFVCSFENCDKKFRNAHKLKVHTECHLGLKKYQCDYCSAPFQQRNHVYRHITSVHLKPEFRCEIPGCNSKYARKDFLRSHVKSHHNSIGEANLNVLLENIKNMKDVEIDQSIYSISKIQ